MKAVKYMKIGFCTLSEFISTLSEIRMRSFKGLKILENQPCIVGSEIYKYLLKVYIFLLI